MNILKLISTLIMKKPVQIIFTSIIVIMIIAIGARNVNMATGNDTLIETDTKVYQDNLQLEDQFGSESIVVLYEADNIKKLLTPESFKHMELLENQLTYNENIYAILSPNSIIQQMSQKQYEKYLDGLNEMALLNEKFKKMTTYTDNMEPSIPKNQETLNNMLYDENGKLRDLYSEMIIDDKYMMFLVKFKGNVNDSVKTEVVTLIKDYLHEHQLKEVNTLVSGKPVLDDSIRTEMKSSMKKMMGLSILFMITVLSVIFKVRWRILPLITILIAVIGTIGLMGWLSIPITMVSMAVFPILIGLGIDYAIQFQSRYNEEMEGKGEL